MTNVLTEFGELKTPEGALRWAGLVTSPQLPRILASTIMRTLEVWADRYEAKVAEKQHLAEGWKLGLNAFERSERRFAGGRILKVSS